MRLSHRISATLERKVNVDKLGNRARVAKVTGTSGETLAQRHLKLRFGRMVLCSVLATTVAFIGTPDIANAEAKPVDSSQTPHAIEFPMDSTHDNAVQNEPSIIVLPWDGTTSGMSKADKEVLTRAGVTIDETTQSRAANSWTPLSEELLGAAGVDCDFPLGADLVKTLERCAEQKIG